MEKKTISINPDLFSTGGKRKSNKKKTKRIKPRPVIKPNVMQKALLERIKEHQSKNEKGTKKISTEEISGSEFEKHLDILAEFLELEPTKLNYYTVPENINLDKIKGKSIPLYKSFQLMLTGEHFSFTWYVQDDDFVDEFMIEFNKRRDLLIANMK